MPRIKRQGASSAYISQRKAGAALKERADCAIVALSVLTDQPYDKVRDIAAKHGRQAGQGTHWFIIHRTAQDLGFELTRLGPRWKRELINSYPGIHKQCHNLTSHHPQRFKKAWAQQPPMLLDFRANHVAAFKGGRVHDWSEGRAKWIDDAYILVPID